MNEVDSRKLVDLFLFISAIVTFALAEINQINLLANQSSVILFLQSNITECDIKI